MLDWLSLINAEVSALGWWGICLNLSPIACVFQNFSQVCQSLNLILTFLKVGLTSCLLSRTDICIHLH